MDPRLDEAVRRARRGDPRAFRTVAEHLGPDLVRYLTFYLNGDVHAAHDVAQDTLIRAWDTLGDLNDGRHLRRWCYRVARCRAVSWIRRRGPPGRKVQSLDIVRDERSGLDPASRPEPAPAGDDLQGSLRRALARLPAEYAGPVHLFYVQGCSTDEGAELLDISRAAFKMRLHRARAFLKHEIQCDQRHRSRVAEAPRRLPP